MGKIRINLVSGSVLEKPLISCFKGTNGNYIVLDNESNGSMGLPIIIISKINGTNLEKIIDPAEWGAVKENLKTIIGGTALPYLAVPETLSAPDDFFTQLTLPVASYDLLKSVYAPPVDPTPAQAPQPAPAPVEVQQAPAAPAIETPAEITLAPIPETPAAAPVVNQAPTAAPEAVLGTAQVTSAEPVAMPQTPSVVPTPAPAPAPMPTPSVVPTPEVNNAPVSSMPAQEANPMPGAQAMPQVEAVPVIEAPVLNPTPAPAPEAVPSAPAVQSDSLASAPAIDLPQSQPVAPMTGDADIAKIKETFMKSCENMFDALMKKFENKN